MRFEKLPLHGAYLIHMDKMEDERGFFGRLFCANEMRAAGLEPGIVQCNNSLSRTRGTTRGLHYQVGAHRETKVLRAISGRLVNVMVDLNPDSPTFMQHCKVELSAAGRTMTYVPRGFGNGLQTLEDDTEIIYFVSNYYAPAAERGVRWNDPAFGIDWPLEPTVMSPKDRGWPDFDRAKHSLS